MKEIKETDPLFSRIDASLTSSDIGGWFSINFGEQYSRFASSYVVERNAQTEIGRYEGLPRAEGQKHQNNDIQIDGNMDYPDENSKLQAKY